MNDIAIRVENLSKRYRIGCAQSHGDCLRSQRPDTLRDALITALQRSNVRPSATA